MVDISLNDGDINEYYGEWFKCPECGAYIIHYSNYCSNCGVALNWVDGEEK